MNWIWKIMSKFDFSSLLLSDFKNLELLPLTLNVLQTYYFNDIVKKYNGHYKCLTNIHSSFFGQSLDFV